MVHYGSGSLTSIAAATQRCTPPGDPSLADRPRAPTRDRASTLARPGQSPGAGATQVEYAVSCTATNGLVAGVGTITLTAASGTVFQNGAQVSITDKTNAAGSSGSSAAVDPASTNKAIITVNANISAADKL